MIIGKEIFFVDLGKDAKVVTGVIVGTGISTSGYPLFDIKTKTEVFSKESAFVFGDRKQAQEALETMLPIQNRMNKVRDDAQKELDELRKQIIGDPIYAHLLEKSKKGDK